MSPTNHPELLPPSQTRDITRFWRRPAAIGRRTTIIDIFASLRPSTEHFRRLRVAHPPNRTSSILSPRTSTHLMRVTLAVRPPLMCPDVPVTCADATPRSRPPKTNIKAPRLEHVANQAKAKGRHTTHGCATITGGTTHSTFFEVCDTLLREGGRGKHNFTERFRHFGCRLFRGCVIKDYPILMCQNTSATIPHK